MQLPFVAVTGGAGFIGKHLVESLACRGYRVRAIDLESRLQHRQTSAAVELVPADLRLESEASAAISGIDVCIALAARSAGLGYFNRHPATMLHDNTQITASSFSALLKHRVKRVIYISSSCLFDPSPAHVATESLLSRTPPPEPGYPFSKLIGEAYCRAFASEFGMSYTIVRPFNVYGPGELPGTEWGDAHVIPDLVAKILSGIRPIPIFGSGYQTRSFTYVTDVVSGIIRALEFADAAHNEDFNLGTPEEVSIETLLRLLWELTGNPDKPFVEHLRPFPVDTARRAVDISKASRLLRWKPEISLSDGLARYIAWYRSRPELRQAKLSWE